MRRELVGIIALALGAFLAVALLPWPLTGPLGARLGAWLWQLLGLGALFLPILGALLGLAAFGRLGAVTPARAAVLAGGLGFLVPLTIGVLAHLGPDDFLPPVALWSATARLVGLAPGFVAVTVVGAIGVVGGVLVALVGLSVVTLVTVGWHPLVALRGGGAAGGKGEGGRGKGQEEGSGWFGQRKAGASAVEAGNVLGDEDVIAAPESPPPSSLLPGPSSLLPRSLLPRKSRRARSTASPAPLIPSINLLARAPDDGRDAGEAELDRLGETLVDTLRTFKVEGTIAGRTTGPVVTQFEVAPGPGVKVGRIAALADDLALAMRAQSVRIVAPIPGKGVVGVEIPNPHARLVSVRELIDGEEWHSSRLILPVALGRDLTGRAIVADLARMPHLLIAGATGSGKSVCINALITSLVYRYTPERLRFLMIDPKMVELSMYNVLPHLRHPVVTNNHKAATALKWAVHEMERRYHLFHANKTRNIGDFNRKVEEGKELVDVQGIGDAVGKGGEVADPSPFPLPASPYVAGPLPFVVLIVDELADLMMTVQGEIETPLAILAQKARAVGIHLVLATQRPSVNVITGLIKANFPSRIAFRVASKVDSRTILDQNGAEALLGNGDMLFLPPARSEPVRIQGCYIGTEETEHLMRWYEERREALERRAEPDILEQMAALEAAAAEAADEGPGVASAERDSLFRQAAEVCIQHQLGSTSLLQRRLSIGYGRAARIIDQLELAGVLGPANGSKPRDVLVGLDELDGMG